MSSRIQDAAQLIALARQSHVPITDFPKELVPESLEDAYAIQDIVARGEKVYGWKVGPYRGDQEPRCAPLLGETLFESPWDLSSGIGNIDAVELEVFVKLKRDLPPFGNDYTSSDVLNAVASLHLGIELVGSRFQNRTTISPFLAIADNQSNGGAVIGASIEDFSGLDLTSLDLRLSIDGSDISPTIAGAPLDDILTQIAWLANHTSQRSLSLKAGDIIMTGARVGPVSIAGARSVSGAGNRFEAVLLNLKAA